ncbi:unnamed protein product [Notodromas monacha]|uniref:Ubiquitin carboxyl-terminal hydrolase n=1 Tax=Notodromas monacha TaxID=399045 RepID=A0A7R9BP54_9CRUS|nr:unnamed protein product [Notodromas monacha]CAG0919109.1 unnamed protein product [Notodromas monacha]
MEMWTPLESNPEVLTRLAHKVGVPEEWVVSDVFSLDPELLSMIPKPVAALILLLPAGIPRPDLTGDLILPEKQPRVFFMTQSVYNSCGTIALIHAVANSDIDVPRESPLGSIIHGTQDMSPLERGASLEAVEQLSEAHRETSQEGQTAAPDPQAGSLLHFVAFVHREGRLYELDGMRSGLVDHGESSSVNFLSDAAVVCRRILDANPDENRFSILAITGQEGGESEKIHDS